MTGTYDQPSDSRAGSERQTRIERRLALIGPGPVAFFRRACHEMAPADVTSTHIVAHLLREIESALRAVLKVALGEPNGKANATGNSGNEKHAVEIRQILHGLHIAEDHSVMAKWLRLAGQGNEYSLHARAHRNALATPRPMGDDFLEFWEDVLQILDTVLDRFESTFLAALAVPDELLRKAVPARGDIQRLRQNVPNNPVVFDYFFRRLQSPAWLKPLHDEHLFSDPPAPIEDPEAGTVSFPRWPQAEYLTRMAPHAPEAVADILFAIPESTNHTVHLDLAMAAFALPPALAARWVRQELGWLRKQPWLSWLLPDQFAKLVVQLAQGGEVDTALDLASALLALSPDPVAAPSASDSETIRPLPHPRSRLQHYDYQSVLGTVVAPLVDAAGAAAIDLLADRLDEAIHFSRYAGDEDAPADYSYLWRPAMEDHSQNHGVLDLNDQLVSALREALGMLAAADAGSVPELVAQLEQRRWWIFRRLALHLLRSYPAHAHDLVAERLTDRMLFSQPHLRHEYALLAAEQFASLSETQQAIILGWIEEGPDSTWFSEDWQQRTGEPPATDVLERYRNRWRLERLSPVRDALPASWRQRYQAWAAELGEPEHPDFVSYTSGSWTGPTSPRGADDLAHMTVAELVAYLREWQPSDDPMGPSPEGLGRTVTGLVAAAPESYAAQASAFQDLDPTYVRALVSGLVDALRAQRPFSWGAVLPLCRWIVEQPREIPGRQGAHADLDPGWVWARKAVADLLAEGLHSGAAPIPFDYRLAVWEILEPLTQDPQPAEERKEADRSNRLEPQTLAINTVRGQALHAVVRYALWVRRHLQTQDGAAHPEPGFASMPEVPQVLDEHLDPARDPSPAIRTVYGQYLPWLELLDSAWLAANREHIFPAEPALRHLCDAAWNTYIVFCQPYNDTVQLLREEYRRAIERVGSAPQAGGAIVDPDRRLAEHLMVLYWRGRLDLDDANGLLMQFFASAPDHLRAHAVEFVGHALAQSDTPVDADVLERLCHLWDIRLAAAQEAGGGQDEELAAFTWWFTANAFDEEWALSRLHISLARIGGASSAAAAIGRYPLHLILDRLTELAPVHAGPVVACLAAIVGNDPHGQLGYIWVEKTRTILEAVLSSGDAEVRQAAVAMIHRLGAQGHLEFRSLLLQREAK